MHLDIHFGDRLKIVRNEFGFSQQRAADAIGVRREMWAKYEAGAEPGAKAIAGMFAAGFDVKFILTGIRSSPEHEKATGQFGEKDIEEAVRKMLVDASLIRALEIHDEKTFELLVMMTLRNLQHAESESDKDAASRPSIKEA